MKHTKSTALLLLFCAATGTYLVGGLAIGCRNDPPPRRPATAVREILGREESCMGCHADYAGFEPSHDPQKIGCSPCHLGNPREVQKDRSHAGMVLVPGNLSDVARTCGTADCHGAIARRVENSLMASMAGVITVDRFVFGASDTLSAWAHVQDLGETHAADLHLRQLCASCHLGNEKPGPAPPSEASRGGGCIACHLDYSRKNDFAKNGRGKFHPAVNLNVTNDHCFGCHSRSGRISTNYEGWHETTLTRRDITRKHGFRTLEDGRVFRAMPPDAHHTAGLDCVDCHSAKELMGDGQRYLHKEDAVRIRCQDCHFDQAPPTAGPEQLDVESQKILLLRKGGILDAAFVRQPSGDLLWNVFLDKNGQAVMMGKNKDKRYTLKPPAKICTRGAAHDALTCSACHSGWAPQCVGCHNTFEPDAAAFDQLSHQTRKGKWEEHLGEFFAERPTLGVVNLGQARAIKPFVPGMILSIDHRNTPGHAQKTESFHRLFSPAAPHTTTRKGRSCTSCHNDPLALGYGRGALKYQVQNGLGRWTFEPAYATTPQDGLPQDAWIGFLGVPAATPATRPNARPFNIAEQRKILQVGACLTCHKGDSRVMQQGLDDFEGTLKKMSRKCALPVWAK